RLRKARHMPRGPRGEKRPADVIGAAVMVGRIATGEIEDRKAEPRPAVTTLLQAHLDGEDAQRRVDGNLRPARQLRRIGPRMMSVPTNVVDSPENNHEISRNRCSRSCVHHYRRASAIFFQRRRSRALPRIWYGLSTNPRPEHPTIRLCLSNQPKVREKPRSVGP